MCISDSESLSCASEGVSGTSFRFAVFRTVAAELHVTATLISGLLLSEMWRISLNDWPVTTNPFSAFNANVSGPVN